MDCIIYIPKHEFLFGDLKLHTCPWLADRTFNVFDTAAWYHSMFSTLLHGIPYTLNKTRRDSCFVTTTSFKIGTVSFSDYYWPDVTTSATVAYVAKSSLQDPLAILLTPSLSLLPSPLLHVRTHTLFHFIPLT